MPNILRESIEKMILAYPFIHGHRAACLRYLFCTNSPGFEWKDGVLVDVSNPKDEIVDNHWDEQEYLSELMVNLPEDFSDEELVLDLKASRLLWIRRHNADIDFRKANADILSRVNEPLSSIPDLNKFSNMACVPDDVHIDYLNGVKEMIFIIFDTPKDALPTSDYPKERIIHNIKFAENILSELNDRFGKRHPEEPTSFKEWLLAQETFINELSVDIEAEIA
jgi:hypothetical protein